VLLVDELIVIGLFRVPLTSKFENFVEYWGIVSLRGDAANLIVCATVDPVSLNE
jgi:hypothetical protein